MLTPQQAKMLIQSLNMIESRRTEQFKERRTYHQAQAEIELDNYLCDEGYNTLYEESHRVFTCERPFKMYVVTFKTEQQRTIRIDTLFEEEYEEYNVSAVCLELANMRKERIMFEVFNPQNERIDHGNYIPESDYAKIVNQ